MYTNALVPGGLNRRHVWYPRQQQRLERAVEQGFDVVVPALCGDVEVVHDTKEPEHQRHMLVPIREYSVNTLAEFLANTGVCTACVGAVEEKTGFDWDDYEGEFTVEDAADLQPPDWVGEGHTVGAVEQAEEKFFAQRQGPDDSTADAADALRYADASYGRFARHATDSDGDSGPPPAAGVASVQVDHDLRTAGDVREGGRQHLGTRRHRVTIGGEVDQEDAGRVARLLGERVHRAARDRR